MRQDEHPGLVVDGIEFLADRPGEVAAPNTQIGEDSPRLLAVATVIDRGAMHIHLRIVVDLIHTNGDSEGLAMDKDG